MSKPGKDTNHQFTISFSELSSSLCQECGRCCIQCPIPLLGEDEAERLWTSSGSPHTLDQFIKDFLYEVDWDGSEVPVEQIFVGKDGRKPKYLMIGPDGRCPFLYGEDGCYECMAYESRPEACRTFDCYPLIWFKKYLVTGLLTWTTRPRNQSQARQTVERCLRETNAMMSPPEGDGNFDPHRFIKEKDFSAAIYRWRQEEPKQREQRRTKYRHSRQENIE